MPRLGVFLSSLIIVVALTFNLPNTAKAAEPSETKATIEGRVQELIPDIEAYITSAMKGFDIPGLAIGIVANDRLIYAKGFGVRSKSNGLPVDTRTVFQIGSTTKAFLTATMAIMVDRGKLRWDDRVVDLYPEFRLNALKKAQDAGKIRHVGLSEVTVAEIEQAKKVLPIVSIQNQYNITDRDSEPALDYCQKEKMGFIPWAPIGGGRNPSLRKSGNALEGEAKRHNVSAVELALAWLLQKSPVMLPIPGTSSLAHLEENMAAEKLQLSAEEWKKIEELARS
jgi:hypothetical protein